MTTDTATTARLIFPHQLFEASLTADKKTLMVLIEDDLFFQQFRFHKQKLLLHRASMKIFAEQLEKAGFDVVYVETTNVTKTNSSMARLAAALSDHAVGHVEYFDLVDDWLEQRLEVMLTKASIDREIISSPGFLTTKGALDDYFSDGPDRMQQFYTWQRKRLGILIDNGKPVGGKWSFDEKNRQTLPKDISLPPAYPQYEHDEISAAKKWVDAHFSDNPGGTDFRYAVTHEQAHQQLEHFLRDRLESFGPYEDAIASDQSQLFHSVLSPLLNIGLITPRQVITRTLQYADTCETPIESLEGFVRQIIGWREFMRATYVRYGRQMRTMNTLQFDRPLDKQWWDGTTGLDPVDSTIKRVLDTAYAHHIERLMVLGNALLLLRIKPDDVYDWFMSLFIDAYDWVMVPNVYAMSQFAAGDKITTKPYISGSNYIIKMSDFKKSTADGSWSETWNALYWLFIKDHRRLFEQNYRSAIMVKLYDNMAPEKKAALTKLAKPWLG